MRSNGVAFETAESIHQGAVEYFTSIFHGEPPAEQPSLEDFIAPVISEEENTSLIRLPTIEEVFEAVSSIPSQSSPGPDGFGSGFYTSYWEIVKDDVWRAVKEFFVSKHLPKYFTASYLVLIPKVESATGLLPRLISLEQGAFIPGRSIFENISLTQEMVHSINRRIHGGNIMLKVDMAKAYDRVDCAFLIKLRASFREAEVFVKARGTPIVSHLMYADDVMIFSNGSQRSVRVLQQILSQYERWSGQVHLEDMMNKVRQKISGWKMRLLSSGGKLILLRHVISSMAIHLLAVLQVPQVTISKIHQLMSSFFWGESDGRDKRKWVEWRYICNPVEEGGLGLRALQDCQKALHMRFAWNLIQGNSLWANFFKAKYVGTTPWCLVQAPKGSRFWRMVANCIPLLLNNLKWKIREGDIYFWYDKWRENGPLINDMSPVGSPLLKIKDCRLSDSWDMDTLENLIGGEKVDEILTSLSRPNFGKDVLIWTPMESGHIEDLNHVLFEGDFPKKIWSFVATIFGIPIGSSWKQNAGIWFRRANASTQMIKQPKRLSHRDGMILEALKIKPVDPKVPSCRVVRWTKPPLGWHKLNMDGSSFGNPGSCGIGGVIRNESGRHVQAYASYIGFGSNNKAELMALLQGLRICKALNITKVIVEMDSQKENKTLKVKKGPSKEDTTPIQTDKVEIEAYNVGASRPPQENEETRKLHHDLLSLLDKYEEMAKQIGTASSLYQLLASTNLSYNVEIMVVPLPPNSKS
ncbi:uncharacterized protein LOC122274547 [Carya illinoinensis]|uniref:uncharacterized protein LOC122274547 n=1 Tax=Carya illinoinensis TaxID=32201 RepID=UPI001C719EC3|nr:uncharacterized protein LOC122274547 [Carya illinoinensis]